MSTIAYKVGYALGRLSALTKSARKRTLALLFGVPYTITLPRSECAQHAD